MSTKKFTEDLTVSQLLDQHGLFGQSGHSSAVVAQENMLNTQALPEFSVPTLQFSQPKFASASSTSLLQQMITDADAKAKG